MKSKIQFVNISFYENEWIEKHLHDMALQGWMVKEIGSFYIRYERIEGQECYFKMDYIARKNAFIIHKTKMIKEYESFLKEYGCRYICGQGYRQIVLLPTAHYPFFSDEKQQQQLKFYYVRKEFFVRLLIWLAIAVMISIGVVNGNIFRPNKVFNISFILGTIFAFFVFIAPYFPFFQHSKIKTKSIPMLLMLIASTSGLLYTLVVKNSFIGLFFWFAFIGVVIGIIALLEKHKIIVEIHANAMSKAVVIIIGILTGILLYVGI